MEEEKLTIRERTEQLEQLTLSPYAAHSAQSRGREIELPECDIRTCYQRDRDRILHSKAFRRLKHKTQVFLSPEGDHYRTRLTHTLEVSQIARTIAKALRMNEDLTEAIALGHDLGHTPFGHAGERILNEICEGGFSHVEQSVRIVEKLEHNREGLNLTWEVRDGILNHRTEGHAATLEGRIVRFADKIAYISHDMDDAIRAGILTEDSLPPECHAVLGTSVHDRLDKLIRNIIYCSMDKDDILIDEEVYDAMHIMRRYLFEHLYSDCIAKEEEGKASEIIRRLYEYYVEHYTELPNDYIEAIISGESVSRIVCDYVAGMTDEYAVHTYNELFVPKPWQY